MSRQCNDCCNDGDCKLQASGVVSCSEGNEKSRERQIKDIDGRVLDVIDTLINI